MFYVNQNESTAARRRIPILLTDSATGTTGQTGKSGVAYAYVNINGGSFAAAAGTIAESNFGQYYYEMHPNEIVTLGMAGLHVTAAGCRDYDAIIQVAAFNMYSSSVGATAGDVWSYGTRTITGGLADTVTTLTTRSGFAVTGGTVDVVTNPVAIASTSMSGIAGTVWNSLTSSYSTNGTFGLNILRADQANKLGDVTLYSSGGVNGVDADIHRIANDTAAATSLKNILTGVGSTITGNITGNISGSVNSVTNPVSVSTASMTGIAGTVWSYVTRTLTSGAGSAISAYDVWNYVLSDSNTAGADLVTAASGGGGGITAGDVWSYATRTLTAGGSGISSGDIASAVWNAQVANYATAGSNETLGTDTYGQKLLRTVNINRPTVVNTSNGITVGTFNSNAITAAAIASNAITEAKFATDAITSRVIASDAITSAELAPSANTEIADAVWAYATKTITGGTITTNNDKTGYSLSSSQTFDLTGNITGNLTGSVGSVGTVSAGAISAASFQTGAIDSAALASDAVTEITTGVWSAVSRTITGGTITTNSDKTGYSLSGTQSFNLTGNITGNLSGSVGSVSGSVGSVSGSVGSVVGNIGGNVVGSVGSVSGNVSGNVVGSVGSVSSAVTISTATQSSIANSVWSTDISGYSSPSAGYSLAVAGSGGVSAADVWNYNGGRTITGGTVGSVTNDVTVSTTSMTGIAGTTWSYASRTLTSSAGATAGDIWSYGSRTITGGIADTVTTLINRSGFAITGGTVDIVNNAVSVSTASMSGIAGTVWSVGSRTITGGIADTVTTLVNKSGFAITGGTVDTVTNPVIFNSSQYASIASSVWNAGTRTLTSGSGISAYEVWNFGTRTLTSGAGITVSAFTNIVNGPYFIKSNVMMQDGKLDVIKGMVQDIQLTVTDANDNAFDVTALTMSVGAFDEAGTAVTTYPVTGLYETGGLIQFTLDTVVTNTEGRYDLILSAAGSGNTIKFGPLQLLVRPY